MRLPTLLASILLVGCGAAAGWVGASGRRPAPLQDELHLREQPFRLQRAPTDPKPITVGKWLEVPWLFADFDLDAQLELGPDTTLDLLLRRVEPRSVQGVQRLFHGRFTVLRLSTGQRGEPWRTPAAALFDGGGGVGLGPGPLTLQVRARGRRLSANVAGIVLPDAMAADDHGGLALLVRQGTAAVQSLQIEPVPRGAGLPLPVGGGVAALALAFAGVLLCAGWNRLGIAGALLLLGALLGRALVFADLPPLAEPLRASEWIVTLLGLPLAAAVLLPDRPRVAAGVIASLLAALPVRAALRGEAARFPPTPRLEAVFGRDSGSGPAEALAHRVRGPLGVHVLEPHRRYVFLLGGQLLWRRGAAPDEHVEPLLTGELHGHVGPDVDVVCLPTEDGWSAQQWQLFWRCYADYRPRALVFGVPRDEAAADPATGRPRSSPEQLQATLREARDGCRQIGAHLVLLVEDGLPAGLRAAVAPLRSEGVQVLELAPGETALQIAQQLGAALGPHLE